MRPIKSTLVAMLVSSASCPVLAQEAQTIAPVRSCNCSDLLLRQRISEGLPADDIQASREMVQRVPQDQVQTALETYRAQLDTAETSSLIIKGTDKVRQYGMAIGSSVLPDTAANYINLQAELTVEAALSAQDERRNQARDNFRNGVLADQLMRNAAASAALQAGNGKEAYGLLFGGDSPMSVLSGYVQDQRLDDAGRQDLLASLGQITAVNLTELAGNVSDLADSHQSLIGEFVDLRNHAGRVQTEINNEVQDIRASINGLNAAYEEISGSTNANAYQLERLQGIIFGKMSPEEKYDALSRGEFSSILKDMSPEQRESYRNGAEKAGRIATMSRDMKDGSAMASGVLTILANTGMDVGGPQEALNDLQTLVSGGLAIYAGGPANIIAGISMMSNVFGNPGSGPDAGLSSAIKDLAADMRTYHEDEMKLLRGIDKKIDDGFARFDVRQSETLLLLGQLSEYVKEVLSQGISACSLLLDTNGTSLWLLPHESFPYRDFNNCGDALANILNSTGGGDFHRLSGAFRHDEVSVNHPDASSFKVRKEIIGPMLQYSRAAVARIYPSCRPHEVDAILLRALIADPRRDGLVRAAVRPPNVKDPCTMIRPPAVMPSEGGHDRQMTFSLGVISHPIDFTAMAKVLNYAAEVIPVYERMEVPGGNARVQSATDQVTLSGQGLKEMGRQRIRYAQTRLSHAYATGLIATMQINLLAGDLLMEQLEEDLLAGVLVMEQREEDLRKGVAVKSDPLDIGNRFPQVWSSCTGDPSIGERYISALCALSRNTILRANFGRYLIRKHLKHGASTAKFRYQFAVWNQARQRVTIAAIKDTFQVELPVEDRFGRAVLVFPFPLQTEFRMVAGCDQPPVNGIRRLPCGYSMLSGDIRIPLPEWHEVATDRQFIGAPDGVDVIHATHQIAGILATYAEALSLDRNIRGLAHEAAIAMATPISASEP